MATITAARALTSGVMPSRTFEYMTMGRVLDSGPETKLAMTRSSKDKVKASNQPDSMAGAISGRMMSKVTPMGRQPKSMAASSKARSMAVRRACTTTAT